MANLKNRKIKKSKNNKKALANDTKWCLSNLSTLTTRSFYDEFGDEFNSAQKISRRYKNIINNELKGVKNIVNIRKEHDTWMKSKENTEYWLGEIREETVTGTHIEGARYVQDVIRAEMNEIRAIENSQSEEVDEATNYLDDQNEIIETEETDCTQAESWILENGVNATYLFNEYYKRIVSSWLDLKV